MNNNWYNLCIFKDYTYKKNQQQEKTNILNSTKLQCNIRLRVNVNVRKRRKKKKKKKTKIYNKKQAVFVQI